MESGTKTNRNSNRDRALRQIIQLAFCLLLLSSVGVTSSLLTSLARQEAGADREPALSLNHHQQPHKVQIIEDEDDGEGDGESYFDLENQVSSESESASLPLPLRAGTGTGTGAGGSRVRRTRSPNPYAYSYERRVLNRAKEGPPKIQPTVSNVQAIVGSNVTLECFIESYPQSVNYWIINSERLQADTDKYKISDDRTNARNFEYMNRLRLHIVNVDGNDYGSVFSCFATNEYGTNYKAIRIAGHQPIIEGAEERLTTVEASIGSGFVLECIISAVPDGINYWTRWRRTKSKDEPVNSTSRISLTQHAYNDNLYKSISRLRVNNVELEDFTTYKCKSKNKNGEAEKKFQVIKSAYVLPKRNDKLTSGSAPAASLPKRNTNLELIFIFSTSLFITSTSLR